MSVERNGERKGGSAVRCGVAPVHVFWGVCGNHLVLLVLLVLLLLLLFLYSDSVCGEKEGGEKIMDWLRHAHRTTTVRPPLYTVCQPQECARTTACRH